ncbi:MAG: acetyl-CoA decarbonylase/synthase complex subunit delta [Spirochaetaceae bacterium]|nr:acetyl-CoA decarbonylase/synthase complex subunit delta [Spirochaetaceae bacterium]
MMKIPDVGTTCKMNISTVTIGALKEEGGTRGRKVTIGGECTLPHLTFDGDNPHKPVIAGYVSDIVPDWPDFLQKAIGKEIHSPDEWAQKCVEDFKVDLISIKLLGGSSERANRSPEDCAKLIETLLKAVEVPLIIWGSGDMEKDRLILQECSQAARGENCLLGSATESNYMTMAAICKADKHKLISEAPVDINIGKQVNILLEDAGFNLDDVVMFQTTAALGYGFDYVYTIMERARIAGLQGDKLMARPQLCDIGEEVWRTKEATMGEDILPRWGDVKKRGPMWEAVCAQGYLQAGADLLIMAHPEAIRTVRKFIA